MKQSAKKIPMVLLMSAMLLSLAACDGNDRTAEDTTTPMAATTPAITTTTAVTTTETSKQTEESKPDATDGSGDQQPDTPPETVEKREHYSLVDYSTGLTYFTTEADRTAAVDFSEPYSSAVIIPSSIFDYQVIAIRQNAFAGNEQITKVTIPAGVKRIEEEAFSYCTNLTSVVFENPEGWTVNGESVDVSDPAVAAELLTGAYGQYIWTRS